jgi:hypothetical protein
VNAFLLLTSAALAGADPVPAAKPGPVAGAPVTSGTVVGAPAYGAAHGGPVISSAPAGGSCCGGGAAYSGDCGCGCDDGGWWGRMKGRFHRNKGCGCETSCDCGSTCDSGCGCEGGGFWGKMKGRFHRNKGCGCEDSCGCGCGGGAYGGAHYGAGGTVIGAPGTMAPVGEPIKAPKDGGTPAKKLPDGGKKPAGSTSAIPEVTPLPPLATQGVGTGTTANPF